MKIVINIDVPALVPAIDFYCLAFGLAHTRTLDSDVAELTGAATTIYLLQKATGSPAAADSPIARRYERHWTPVHFDVVVSDLDAAVTRAIAAGARVEAGPIEWRGSRCVTLADPFGHGFCLLQFADGQSYQD
jgi:predicted enzyme related to lactoylglutathione lyase